MAKARNLVVAGAYEGRKVRCSGSKMIFDKMLTTPVEISSATVASYQVVDQESSRSLGSALGRGLVGNALLGSVGMVAGAMTGKSNSIILVSIEFKNGDRSLIEIDANTYKVLMRAVY